LISAVVKSWQPNGLLSLGHIVRNSIDFIKEPHFGLPSMPGIFSQKYPGKEHKTPPGSAIRTVAGIAYEVGFDDLVYLQGSSTRGLARLRPRGAGSSWGGVS
jgi:hypothetical protein